MTEPTETPQARVSTIQGPRPALRIDRMPANRTTLATMPVEQRTAIYLNQIRMMLIFFVVLATIGIVVGVILGIVDINALHSAQQAPTLLGG